MNLIPNDGGIIFQINRIVRVHSALMMIKERNPTKMAENGGSTYAIVIQTHLKCNPFKYVQLGLNVKRHLCIATVNGIFRAFKLIYRNFSPSSTFILIDSIDTFIITSKLVRIVRAFKFVGFKVFLLSKESQKYWFIDDFV